MIRDLFSKGASSSCTSREQCRAALDLAHYSANTELIDHGPFPLNIWGCEADFALEDLCPECRMTIEGEGSTLTLAIWDKLPVMYGLPHWPDLLARRNLFMGVE